MFKHINYNLLPEHIRGAAQRWIEHGISPDSFLEAAFRDQLVAAYSYADATNKAAMHDIVEFLYWQAPVDCRGEHYDRWAELHKRARESEQQTKESK